MSNASRNSLKILIVDGNPLLQSALKDMLALWGIGRIVTVGTGEQARELLRRESFDLMVTDWVMGPVTGDQLLQWVRQSPGCLRQDLPVVVLTGNADLATVRTAWDAGADTVLAKPVTASTLVQRIESVLNRRGESGIPPNVRAASRGRGRADVPENGPSKPETATYRLPQAEPPMLPPGADLPRLPPSAAGRLGQPNRQQQRLLIAVSRLEKAIAQPDTAGERLRHALSDLQLAASREASAQAIVSSLATCVTWVDAASEGFTDTLHAHAAALRWVVACDGSAESRTIGRALLRSLRATVRALALSGSPIPSVWPDVRAHAGPDTPEPDLPPLQ